jgi:hypothetical protein
VTVNVDLEPGEARYLSILAAGDLRTDEERRQATRYGPVMSAIGQRHRSAWEKLQPACRWDDDE